MSYPTNVIGKLLPVLGLVVFSAQACAGLPDAPVREDVREEQQLLEQKKEERVQNLERQLQVAAGEQKMAVLLQLADLGSAPAFDIIDRNIDSIGDRPTLLNAVASKGQAEARPLLLRAVNSWGPDADHPIERLHYAFGPEIAANLRDLLARNPTDAVQRAIRTELIQLKDEQAILELRLELANSRLASREDAERTIGVVSLASDCVDVAADVGRLFRRVDERRSDVHRQLKQFSAGIALWLGDRDSAEHVIQLLASPGSDYFNYPGLHSLVDLLKTHTKQTFARPEEWKTWWASNGGKSSLFTVHVAPEDEAEIINAVIAWGRDQASGPIVPEPVVYLQLDSRTMSDRERIRARLDADIRPYTAIEISLLGKTPYSVSSIETNGETAFATIGDGSNAMNWQMKSLELATENAAWRVRRVVELCAGGITCR